MAYLPFNFLSLQENKLMKDGDELQQGKTTDFLIAKAVGYGGY
jgi:hypothetical protein